MNEIKTKQKKMFSSMKMLENILFCNFEVAPEGVGVFLKKGMHLYIYCWKKIQRFLKINLFMKLSREEPFHTEMGS